MDGRKLWRKIPGLSLKLRLRDEDFLLPSPFTWSSPGTSHLFFAVITHIMRGRRSERLFVY